MLNGRKLTLLFGGFFLTVNAHSMETADEKPTKFQAVRAVADTALGLGGHRTTGEWTSQGNHRSVKEWVEQGNHRTPLQWFRGEPSRNSKNTKK